MNKSKYQQQKQSLSDLWGGGKLKSNDVIHI